MKTYPRLRALPIPRASDYNRCYDHLSRTKKERAYVSTGFNLARRGLCPVV